ncbi:MAG: hypothetical protein NW224_30710 [Leptolyngbyaceae cyanobacterium bins.302]|nr:hypothetical protein [Leptolyngbyaceae cyanobacterium bins.302]
MSETSRQSLKAYLQLENAHKLLHKTLKALEEDATEDEVVRRVEEVSGFFATARKLLKTP